MAMNSFKYEPIDLEGPAFRLLRLFKGGEPDIECELFRAWLHSESAISYEAFSYTWINGRTLNATENLYLALLHLRSKETIRTLWVDAICIDQCNKKERGHQAQQTGGPATDETGVLMDSLKLLEQESIKRALEGPLIINTAHVEDSALGSRWPWLKRVWVLQEVANAKRVLVCNGSMSVSARIFVRAGWL
ncbi:hypothetical protein CC78DRAFT_555743 [Lojkania enalia]|uniref:Heterokaryon incompatibility domain-containing protein n=1 Tax=Lojkania enalia TaxID=147567 RepID=A0A9P4K0W0_9PLEO|nr:hypothetical protein CC78DRAFT_555743 [Didymosphaeria enalia]